MVIMREKIFSSLFSNIFSFSLSYSLSALLFLHKCGSFLVSTLFSWTCESKRNSKYKMIPTIATITNTLPNERIPWVRSTILGNLDQNQSRKFRFLAWSYRKIEIKRSHCIPLSHRGHWESTTLGYHHIKYKIMSVK